LIGEVNVLVHPTNHSPSLHSFTQRATATLLIAALGAGGTPWVNWDLPLSIPGEWRGPVAQSLPHWRQRLSHRLEGPNRLRGLSPQSRFVAAHAVKQGRVKMGKAQETLGDGAGVAGRQIVSSVRAKDCLVTIGSSGSWERPRLTGSAGRLLPVREQKFALDLKQAGFDRAGATKTPQKAC